MANKTITMNQLRRILQLKEQGHSNRQLSRTLHLSRQTVNDYVKRLNQTQKSFKELLDLDDSTLHILTFEKLSQPVLTNKFTDLQSRMSAFADDLKNPKTTRMIL
jgi:orotate phosphoribosyltransferase-like protein